MYIIQDGGKPLPADGNARSFTTAHATETGKSEKSKNCVGRERHFLKTEMPSSFSGKNFKTAAFLWLLPFENCFRGACFDEN
jgi:hypothetical protein